MRAFFGFLFGLCLSLVLVAWIGENPLFVLEVLYRSAFGSKYDLGLTLFYTTNLIFTGLSVAVAFRAGLFNIGAEGQLHFAAIMTAWLGISFATLPMGIALPLAFLAATGFGFLYGLVPGVLRAYRGSHEVIVTMMMNFVAAGIASYLTLNVLKNPDSQNPETAPVGLGFFDPARDLTHQFFDGAPVNYTLWIALLLALLVFLFLSQTTAGYRLRAVGLNAASARFSGIDSQKMQMLAMGLAGALAGFVALNEITGSAGKYRIGFSADYGFVGIAVALMARNHPLGILVSAFLFGALQKGAADLDFETELITRDFARVIQGIVILFVTAFYFIDFRKLTRKWRSS
ncbi:MAG: ABC transporter permease [Pseudobdellovibrionaceae bacterium]